MDIERRRLLSACLAWSGLGWLASAGAQPVRHDEHIVKLLQQGGCAVLIRHAQTVPGIGDPVGFQIGACHTQRLLSSEGREDARRLGQWFQSRQLKPADVLSSQWCRCQETAMLAFGRHTDWPALNSTFPDGRQQAAQTAQIRKRLAGIANKRFEVWVTHQVNMTDLTGAYPATGEGFVVDRTGALLGRWTAA